MKTNISHIGLVAGDNNLPFFIKNFAMLNNIDLSIAGILGPVSKDLKKNVDVKNYKEFYITELSKVIDFFKNRGVSTVLIVGGVHNSKFKLTFDFIKILFKLIFVKKKYDGVLRLVIKEFEKAGLKVIGIQDLMPDLLIKREVITNRRLSDAELNFVKAGFLKAKKFADTDRGQSVVISKNKLVAVEKFNGTDKLIERSNKIDNSLDKILIKVVKPAQDRRVDIPVIGVNTIYNLMQNGFSGVAVEANATIIDNKERVIKLANENNIFIVGI